MVRTQVYLTEDEKAGLESASALQGISQSNLIRLAIDELLNKKGATNKAAVLEEIAGIWAERTDIPDVRELRSGWRQRPSR